MKLQGGLKGLAVAEDADEPDRILAEDLGFLRRQFTSPKYEAVDALGALEARRHE